MPARCGRAVTTAWRPEPLESSPAPVDRVWYAAYGSNMRASRLGCYLVGGRPPGGARTCPGCRDPRSPERTLPVLLRGRLYFALESAVWTGGMGFYDPDDPDETPARAYLVTASQFADIAAQEMRREPGTDLDLSAVLRAGRARLGPGRYDTLVCAGTLAGCPVLTFTAPWRSSEVDWSRPSAAYLRTLATGLVEAHGWDLGRAACYLSTRPGAEGAWSSGEIEGLLQPAVGGGPSTSRSSSPTRRRWAGTGPAGSWPE